MNIIPAVAVRLVAAVSATLPIDSMANLSCPFADGNGPATGACLEGQGPWQTSLLARDWRGNGVGVDAYYDPVLNLTWLVDANFGQVSSAESNGAMTFSRANAWADELTLFGGNDWRLPTLAPVDDSLLFNTTFSNNGSTDRGHAKSGVGWAEHSELGYMFYVHLGNRSRCTPNDSLPGTCSEQAGFGLLNTGPFKNLTDTVYWTNTAYGDSNAWLFNFFGGYQGDGPQNAAVNRA